MTRPIVFVDTETTGLELHARPWEIAVIRREIDGTQSETVLQVAYDLTAMDDAGATPVALHIGGWLLRGQADRKYLDALPDDVATVYGREPGIAQELVRLLDGDPILVGVGVHFDALMISSLFRRRDLPEQPWHYSIVDLKAVTYGVIRAQMALGREHEALRDAARLPMSSERLAAALGDARWAARWFDALPTDATTTETRDR